ncbi:MAG: integration host factor subunit beta [Ignavibacteriae bacterium]|nr:integration host factor subunit beta [Ignavibacteriota bacterium]MCB9217797.1 integration host factor subunit beta [Ignavibacteria bacterium]
MRISSEPSYVKKNVCETSNSKSIYRDQQRETDATDDTESVAQRFDVLQLCSLMTKSDVIDRVAEGTGLTKLETEAVINGFLKTIVDALAESDSIELRGFGTFRVKERAPRTGRNPKTGKIVEIDVQYVPHFKMSREVRKHIDEMIKTLNKE